MPATKASPIGNDTPCAGALLALAALATLAALLPGRAGEAAEPCEPSVGRIVSLQGLVEVQLAGGVDWAGAALDDRLCIGDSLRVGAYSQAAVALANDSVASVDQLTTMRFVGEGEGGRSWIDLLLGVVHFFSHRPRALEVDTPIANAFTEGTEFLVRARPERTEVILLDGRVRLVSPEGEVLLASGDAGVAEAGAAPRREIVARPRDAVAWALYYPPILSPLAERAAAPSLPAGLRRAVERVAEVDYAGALAALDAVPAAARDARYHAYRAGVLLHVGRVDEAAAAIERALALNPEAAEALAQRAVIAVVQNREEAALADARRAVELAPDSAPARIALSYALQAAFELEVARAVLREAAARTPDDPLVFARLAEIELSFGDLRAAQAAAARAVALAPGLAHTQMVLGFAALTRIEIDEAKAAVQRAIELDSALPLARLGLGLARIREGDLEEGRRELEIAAALDPNDSLLRSYLGKAYFEERRGPLDADQFQIAKQLDPNDPTPYFYDAIRLQTENRPGEALQNLQKSIELNDNRAIYRSRLLLDADRAARGTSLALIYDDLGFLQPGIQEASKSLTLEPANAGAHRFLSDIYQGVRRRGIARVSNLLQAQMLQDININPVQPSLSEANLNLVTHGGPAQAGFNEFTPLFERNQAQFNMAGVVGNKNTYGGEGVASMVYDRYSLSVGAFGYRTDGWRDNNDIKQDVEDVYFQSALTPELNAQVEFRRRHSDEGDLPFNFDPDNFAPNFRRDFDTDTYRAGVRYSPAPSADFLLSAIYSNFKETDTDSFDIPPGLLDLDVDIKSDGYQLEGQHIYRQDWLNLTIGGAYNNRNEEINVFQEIIGSDIPPLDISEKDNVTSRRPYAYANVNFPKAVIWTFGLSYDDLDASLISVKEVNPKVGVQVNVTDDLLLRAAYFQFVKPVLANNQTLEPTQVAGFNQLFDDTNGARSKRWGVGLDWSPLDNLFVGGEATWRSIDLYSIFAGASDEPEQNKFDLDEQTHRVYVNWLPDPELALSAEFVYDRFQTPDSDLTLQTDFPEKVETYSAPLGVRYFHTSGAFAGFGVTYVNQDVKRSDNIFGLGGGNDDFVYVDASIGYRLPKRSGIISFGVTNLLDTDFHYQDDSFREFQDQPSVGPYFPERLFFGRITLNW